MGLRAHLKPAVGFICVCLTVTSLGKARDSPGLPECSGRRVYVHELPAKFNTELLFNQETESVTWFARDIAQILARNSVNLGLGKEIPDPLGVPGLEGAWYQTDQNSLERIFHMRMLTHSCRVMNHKEADLIYVPYYGRHDSLRHGFKDFATRDSLGMELVDWLRSHPAWSEQHGANHFWVFSNTIWDFYRRPDATWGSNLLSLDGVKDNMWMICGETSWQETRVFSAPYPTAFHPKSAEQVRKLQAHVSNQERRHLFAIVGAKRDSTRREGSLRNRLFWQCGQSSHLCGMIECSRLGKSTKCHNMSNILALYGTAHFCLHPIGDACTRRSLIDAALMGCIPVVFYNCTLKDQYKWHMGDLVSNDMYVFIPEAIVRGEEDTTLSTVLVEEVLQKIPESRLRSMHAMLVELIPSLLYGGHVNDRDLLAQDFKDAVDVILDGVAKSVKDVGIL